MTAQINVTLHQIIADGKKLPALEQTPNRGEYVTLTVGYNENDPHVQGQQGAEMSVETTIRSSDVCEISITGDGNRWEFRVTLPDGGDLLENGITGVTGVATSRRKAHEAAAKWAAEIEGQE